MSFYSESSWWEKRCCCKYLVWYYSRIYCLLPLVLENLYGLLSQSLLQILFHCHSLFCKYIFHWHRPFGKYKFHLLGPLGRVSQRVAMSLCLIWNVANCKCNLFWEPLIGPDITWSVSSLSMLPPPRRCSRRTSGSSPLGTLKTRRRSGLDSWIHKGFF